MPVAPFPNLHEEDLATEVIHHLLPARGVPPLDGKVALASRDDDPKRDLFLRDLLHLRHPVLFLVGKRDVALEYPRLDPQTEPLAEVFNKAVDEMIRILVALVDERVIALDHFRFGIIIAQRGDVRIVLPQRWA